MKSEPYTPSSSRKALEAVRAGRIASGRACAICAKRTGSLTGMRGALLNLGIFGGYAHHRCYDKARGAKIVSQR